MGTLSRLRDFTADRDAVPPVAISAQGMDDEFDQLVTESNAQDVRLDTLEAGGNVSTGDLADDAVTPAKASFIDDTLAATDTHIMVADGTDFDNVAVSGDATLSNAGVLTIGNDKIVTAKILDANVTTAKIADANVTTAKILDANVTTAKVADSNITTAKIADANVTTAKVADANITSGKLASDSVVTAKILDANVTTAKVADSNITSGKLASDSVVTAKILDANITTAKIADANVTTAKIADANVTTAKILDGNVTLAKLVDPSATNKLLGRTTAGNGDWEEVAIQTTLTSTDESIPTSKAVRDDIVSLLNDVGGFVAVADDQSFPNTNPDPDDGVGTVVSIANAGGLVVNGSGVTTTGRSLGSSTVTISGIPSAYQSTTIADGLGMHVITTTTLHTYTYHKIIAKEGDTNTVATNISSVNTVGSNISNISTVAGQIAPTNNLSTVAGISSNVSTVAGISANVTTVAGISSNVTTVSGNNANVTTVAGQISPTNNIGTVAGNSANVTTVAGISANVTTVAGISSDVTGVAGISSAVSAVNSNSSNINAVNSNETNINAVNSNSSNINTVAGNNSNVTTVAGSIANVNTTATNIADVNNFANVYRIASSDPASSVDEGDLVFRTDTNVMRVYNGSAWQNVAPVSSAMAFGTLTVSGQSDVVADSTSDTLTIAGTGGTTITTNAGADTITIDTPTAGASIGDIIALS